jgi:L-fuconate dehydratase
MIQSVSTRDARFAVGHGHGRDAIYRDPIYSYAVTELRDDLGGP